MNLPEEILADLRSALEVLERDTSAAWLIAAADALETLARRIRHELTTRQQAPS